MKVLVPTDFSECASRAAEVAVGFTRWADLEIHFLHIASVPPDWHLMNQDEKWYLEVSKRIKFNQEHLDLLTAMAEKKGASAEKFLIFNKDYHAILDHITKYDIDLVIMGSAGASGIKQWLIGSNTQKIVRMSSVPVLVIKDNLPRDFALNHLVFVSDFKEQVMEQFKAYVAFARMLGAKISLLFINTPENFTDTLTTKIMMGNYALHAPGIIEDTFVFNSRNFLEGLEHFCEENSIDAIGMITHGRTSAMHLFNNSLTEKVVNHVKIPVLTMHFSEGLRG